MRFIFVYDRIEQTQISPIMNHIGFRLFLLLALLCGQVSTNALTQTLSSYLTLVQQVTYTLNFTFTSTTITASATPIITFSLNYMINVGSLSNCQYVLASNPSYIPASCTPSTNTSGNYLLFSGIYGSTMTAQSFLSLQFKITNPWGAQTESISINLFDVGGNVLTLTTTTTITYTASSLGSCAWSSNSVVNGQSSVRTIAFTPSVQVISGSFLQITAPLWFYNASGIRYSNLATTISCAAISNLDMTPVCTNQTLVPNQIFTATGLFSSNKTISDVVSFSIANLYNPWSLRTFGPIKYQLRYTMNSVTATSQICSNIYQTTTQLNALTSYTFSFTNTISTSSSRFLRFFNLNPIPATGGQFMIAWSGITITYTGAFTNLQNSSRIVLSNFLTSDLAINSNFMFSTGFNVITPTSTRAYTLTLTTLFSTGGTTYGIDTLSFTGNCIAGTLTAASLLISSLSVNVLTQYVINFRTVNALTTGSYIGVTFPSTLQLTTGNTCSSNTTGLACTVTTSTYANISISRTLTAATSLSLTFSSVTNPNQVLTTSSITVATYYDSGLDSLVDQLTSGLTMTSTANVIPLANVFILPTSLVTYASNVNYIFSINLIDRIPAGGLISIQFPPTITVSGVFLSSASFSNVTCAVGTSSNLVSITNCFSVDMTTLGITLTLGGIVNPTTLLATSSFMIYTYGTLGMVNNITSGLPVQMTTLATSTFFSFTAQLQTVYAFSAYTLNITFAIPHVSGDYFTINIPSSMSFGTLSCTPLSGIAAVTCIALTATTLKVTLVAVPSINIQLTINTIRNYQIPSFNVSFQAIAYNSAGNAMQMTTTANVSYTFAAITSAVVSNNNQIALTQASNLTITLSNPFTLDASFSSTLTSLIVTLPSQLSMLSNSSCSSSIGSGCSTANFTSWVIDSPGLSLVNATISLVNIQIPYLSGPSSSFVIQYFYNSILTTSVSTGVTVSAYCSSPCGRCTSSRTVCLSCLPSPNLFILYYANNNSCLSSCPSGFYTNSSICTGCVSPCFYCNSYSNCSSCLNETWLYEANNTCMGVCPAGFYNDSSKVCLACVPPCVTCLSASSCLSCVNNTYLSNNSCINGSNCPSGTYANSSLLVCQNCTSPCSVCSSTQSNCTSCVGGYVYYNYTCDNICPAGLFINSTICSSCQFPCGNCSSLSYCLSCVSLYLSNGSCVNSSSCPNGTYSSDLNNTCSNCSVNCGGCSINASNCTSCTNPYFFYNNTCVASCPAGMYQNSSNCLLCQLPCGNCTSLSSCLSCVSSFLYNTTCYNITSCPSGTYANTTTNTCSACQNNCSTCNQTSMNCTACANPYFYYNNTCVASCPAGLYQNSSICVICQLPCGNCTSLSSCLSCISSFLYNTTCYNSTSCPGGTYANTTTNICTVCASNCSTCSQTANNCTSCGVGYFNFNQTCVSSCPAGTYSNSSSCANCSSPCKYCTGPITCTSCILNYYFNQSCIISTLCPNGTYGDNSSLNCSFCTYPCATCFNVGANCTSCTTPYLYYSNLCELSCPFQMFQNGSNCVACQFPCGNCTTATYCLSCTVNYTNNGSCVDAASCRNGTYAESLNNTCNLCPSICSICSSATNCSSCTGPYNYYGYWCTNSCPNGTYASSSVCTNCSSTCLTCSIIGTNCTSCSSVLYYYAFQCYSTCPPNYYNATTTCILCMANCSTCSNGTTCSSCSGSLYLINSLCQSSCPIGTYQNTLNNQCTNCSSTCYKCSNSTSNCSSCTASLLYYSSSCLPSCPSNYFNISGTCLSCPSCISCINFTHCATCNSGYYLYQSVCYSTCPSMAPVPNLVTSMCAQCASSCSSCSTDGSYCYTCNSGYRILLGQCYTTCPSGYLNDISGGSCTAIKVINKVYFPSTISAMVLIGIIAYSKYKYPLTDVVGNITAFLGLLFFFSVIVLTFPAYLDDQYLTSGDLSLLLGLGVALILTSFLIGIIFNLTICIKLHKDRGLFLWKKKTRSNRYIFNIVAFLSTFHFSFFRLVYSRLFLRQCFSCYARAHKKLLTFNNWFSFVSILVNNVPSIAISVFLILKQEGNQQTQIYAIDNLIISVFEGIFMLIDIGGRNEQYFDAIVEDLPYLKKISKYNDFQNSSGSLISFVQSEDERRYKTEVEAPKDQYNILSLQNKIGSFGAIEQLSQNIEVNSITKTVPEYSNMNGQIQFNPYELKQLNDDLFFRQREYTKKFKELKEYNQEQREEQLVQDERTEHLETSFINKTVQQIINEKKRDIDPMQLLSSIRSQEYAEISEMEMENLRHLAKLNEVSEQFMTDTFGKKKDYNPNILNELMSKNDVQKDSIQELMHQKNSQTKLQQVLGKYSAIDIQKLKDILNDKDYKQIIEALFNKQTGVVSLNALKDLLGQNNKFSKEFIINLLNNTNIDKGKLKTLIDSNKQGELDSLRIIKELGGQNLENHSRMRNMLGKDSELDPTTIPKIVEQMNADSRANIFDKPTGSAKTIIKKIINNKKINLIDLNPIQQMPEIIEEFAELLTCGNQQLQQNLIDLLENTNYDGQGLKQMVQNAGNSQEQMANLLEYIEQNKKRMKETIIEDWPIGNYEQLQNVNSQFSMPSFDDTTNQKINLSKIKRKQEESIAFDLDMQLDDPKGQTKIRFKKKELPSIRLPSEPIYLQRIQGAHEVQRSKNIRKKKKKVERQGKVYMDEDNQIYDLDF